MFACPAENVLRAFGAEVLPLWNPNLPPSAEDVSTRPPPPWTQLRTYQRVMEPKQNTGVGFPEIGTGYTRADTNAAHSSHRQRCHSRQVPQQRICQNIVCRAWIPPRVDRCIVGLLNRLWCAQRGAPGTSTPCIRSRTALEDVVRLILPPGLNLRYPSWKPSV